MTDFQVPLIIRGKVIEGTELIHSDRSANARSFASPDAGRYVDQIVASSGATLDELYKISFGEILDFLDELSERLNLDTNRHWRAAFEVSCHSSNISRPVLEHIYGTGPRALLRRESVREIAETRIGISYLEGWVPTRLNDGRTIEVRAFGSRSAHIIAGNTPAVAMTTILRTAITRNDAIVKTPSNDPLTMSAIAQTMIEMAPDHPLTKHLTVAYWKGGDERIESRIYHPRFIEKLVAWGGFPSIKHITKYIQPGIDLITLDPKTSTTLIGREALTEEKVMRAVAQRAAADLGGWDQEACVNARVIFIESGTDAAGVERANRFGQYLFEEIQNLPRKTSSGANKFDPRLRAEIDAISLQPTFYKVIVSANEIQQRGAIIVSQMGEQVDFPNLLYGRVGNLVPVDRIENALESFTSATQTIGVYPDALRKKLRDRGAIRGGQVFVPLGYAITGTIAGPQDGIEPERRMCRWVVDMDADPLVVPGPWMHQ